MAYRWVVDAENPQGHLVEMTAAEETQRATDQAAGQARAAAYAILEANEDTIRDRLLTGLATADTHITAMEGTPSAAQQKAAMLFVLKGMKQLARLELSALDATD